MPLSSPNKKLPTFYIPHVGGPWHVMQDAFGDPLGYAHLKEYLAHLGKTYHSETQAIIIISAHWEAPYPTIHLGTNPPMLYDYYGFPESTYQLQWPAKGDPELAKKIENLLRMKGFAPQRENERGFDHGTFVPLMIAFPKADVPVVQLSLVCSLDPATHIAMGKALEPLRSEGVLIVGSGMSYHNMRGFKSGSNDAAIASAQFDTWLTKTVENHDPDERNDLLTYELEKYYSSRGLSSTKRTFNSAVCSRRCCRKRHRIE